MQRLSDIMSHAGLSIYAEVALVLFFVAFLGIVLRAFAPSRRREMEEMARKPLEDDAPPASPGAHT
jgi:cbb3-type cytochrome oxidase subunit 3